MNEIELKLQVPEARRAAVDAALAGRAPRRRMRLQAAYCDTPDRALARAGLALRVRREGRQWVQALKGPADDGLTRLEHEVPRPGPAAEPPAADPALHAGTAAGERLRRVLADAPDASLTVLYRTDILRRSRTLRAPHGSVELAFDVGRIRAGDAELAVCELEIELLRGAPRAVIETARRWLARFGLWIDLRSKALRGDLLARGESMAPPRLAGRVRLARGMTMAQAWQQVLRSCADQIGANASQIASGPHADEHVHQLRVGLRRLRSAQRLFGPELADAALGEAAAAVFRRLGGARDQAVIEAEFAPGLAAALRCAGVAAEPAGSAAPETVDPAGVISAIVRAPETQALLLDLLQATSAAPPDTAGVAAAPADGAPTARPLRAQLARRLERWHRRCVADARRFAELDDAARHSLRKRVKRLRYAVEFCASLFPKAAVRRYLRRLRTLQERLGAINDVVMAMQVFREARAGGAEGTHAWFALGWLAARRELLAGEARADLRGFIKARRFWTGCR